MTTVASKQRPAESPVPSQRNRRSARQPASAVAESPPRSTPQDVAREPTRAVKKRATSTGVARPRRKGATATTLTLRELALPTLAPVDLAIGGASYRVQRVDWRDSARQGAYQRLRAEIFVHQLGWALPLDDGCERDRYDHAGNEHISVHTVSGLDESGAEHLLVGVRVFRLRTWDDAMLMHEFADIGMIDRDVIQRLTGQYDALRVLELTRLCVRPGRWFTIGSNRYNLAVARDLCYASIYALAEQGDQQYTLAIVDSTMHRIMRSSHFAMETVFERDGNNRRGYAVNVVDLAGTLQALWSNSASGRADRFVTLCNGRFARLSPALEEM
jgi:N-acyl-L-homoserine lactone synthetase